MNRDNADLWMSLQHSLQQLAPEQIRFRHVPSHLDPTKCDSPMDEWLAANDSQADAAAVMANNNRPSDTCQLYGEVLRGFSQQAGLCTSSSSPLRRNPKQLLKPCRWRKTKIVVSFDGFGCARRHGRAPSPELA